MRDRRLRAIPFALGRKQAREAFLGYHSNNPLGKPKRDYDKVKEAFVPFWALSGQVRVLARGAQVGYLKFGMRWNAATKSLEPHSYMEWIGVRVNETWERTYSAGNQELQVSTQARFVKKSSDMTGQPAVTSKKLL